MVGVEDVEITVLLEGVIMSGVEEVEVVLEEISNDLWSLLHAGHPLVDGEGGAVEIPLKVELGGLRLLVREVTVQEQLLAANHHRWGCDVRDVDT